MPKNVLAILNIFTQTTALEKVTAAIAKLPEVLDVYEVTGEYDIVALVSVGDIIAFREFLKEKVLKIPGIRSTVTSVVLHTHKKDGKLVSE